VKFVEEAYVIPHEVESLFYNTLLKQLKAYNTTKANSQYVKKKKLGTCHILNYETHKLLNIYEDVACYYGRITEI